MKLYNVLTLNNKEGKTEDILFLKEGFSWLAFIFSIFWFLYHKMWKESFALFIIGGAFVFFEESQILTGDSKFIIEILLDFIIALNANHWFCESLVKKGYKFEGVVFAKNPAQARLRYVQNLDVDAKPSEFSDAILDPKMHRKLMKLEKQKPYFVV